MGLIIAPRVKETTTSTGTGAIALGGAANLYSPFSSRMSVGDTCYYTITAVTNDWECGLGTYSAVNTITRTQVTHSSNSDAAVSFSAGSKDIWIDISATDYTNIRSGNTLRGTILESLALPVML
jgi:hypothetical protein